MKMTRGELAYNFAEIVSEVAKEMGMEFVEAIVHDIKHEREEE